MCRIAAAWEFNARVLTEHHVTKMYEFQVCHWQEHRSQTLRGVVLQKNNRGKNGSVKKLPHHPVMFSCLNSQLKNSNPHQTIYPCIRGKTKPRCRESLGFGYCENPQIACLEREKLWSLFSFALDSSADFDPWTRKNSLSPSPLSFWISVCIACFRVFFRVFSSHSSSLLSVG